MKSLQIINITMALLLATTAVLSCSMEQIPSKMESEITPEGNKILINGIIADKNGSLLKDISVTFTEYEKNKGKEELVGSTSTITDEDGFFTIYVSAPSKKLHCYLTVDDENDRYESQTKEIIITWKGPSYDRESNMFFVNDCNFILIERK